MVGGGGNIAETYAEIYKASKPWLRKTAIILIVIFLNKKTS